MSATIPAVCIGTKYVLDATAVDRIRGCLAKGGLVVHPTDTVYGLANQRLAHMANLLRHFESSGS